MKRLAKIIAVTLLALVFVVPSVWADKDWKDGRDWKDDKAWKDDIEVENLIVMVPDGCTQSIQTLARWVKGSALNIDGLNSGSVKTYMANSVITGSAAAATAFATGHKTSVRFLGVGPSEIAPDGDYLGFLTGFKPTAKPFEPLESLLEAAERAGMATGLISTSRITHATPAAYACHIDDRGKDNEIMEHMVYNDIDVVFGGGARHLIPEDELYATSFGDSWGGRRTDGENLIDVLLDRGYTFVDSAEGMDNLEYGPAWGMFDDSHMDPELDRDDLHPSQPSLADMTEKAIQLLSEDEDGFFLMVEASQVDWAGHANDAAYMVGDFLAFDEAVGKAIAFAEKDGKTLVLIFPDHNTGALSIGHEQSEYPPGYTGTSLEDLIDPIKDASMTIQGLLNEIPIPANISIVRDTFAEYLGDYWAQNMEVKHAEYVADTLNDKGAYDGYYPIAEYLSRELTTYGWTTHGHTGEDVPLWSLGPDGPVVGTIDNTELATIGAEALGLRLRGSKPWKAYDDNVLDLTDSANPVAKIGDWYYPVSKDYKVHKKGRVKYLTGITVHAPAINTVFIPKR
ncbi:MAG: alkaline phosphatase [Candidatus Thiodiazotropha sp. (ex Ctena orbiculata)]|uniref:Alkaline phosphatase n=1 Tax=Candidatus Thiodiazotropha taylori TaxID=2792791 RepID=A0A944QSX7_9GAMM|nr:alkaline phosphatase [Candidatus Thiodiazotropha taylori]MBT2989373.1 alkaline phosphatase [Candidatus Thiodiazotropha taylori]MBT2996953.1 alkaline phosphatase [Candidatus Thiodiazotropha taylori]MBT3000808.1 alkaline phosphatase [Candidatus Thiodiazotropha taylori]MBT3026945.1 alkaline phosphatase [Candidatus Thiodiazotropha taylori]